MTKFKIIRKFGDDRFEDAVNEFLKTHKKCSFIPVSDTYSNTHLLYILYEGKKNG